MLGLEPSDDAEVIGRIRGGDTDAFEVLMRRYNQRVYRAVRSILSDEDEVEDAASTFGGPTPAEKATVVLVDHDLSPSQARNLERATGAEVLDRTSVILSIFQRHARTREARLQVEIARLAYQAPRLRETGGGGDRQRGGIGGKGAGESNLELDRRKIRDRIAELREGGRAGPRRS